jgi:hypothetical protein
MEDNMKRQYKEKSENYEAEAKRHFFARPYVGLYSLGVNTPPLGAVKTNKNNDRMWE